MKIANNTNFTIDLCDQDGDDKLIKPHLVEFKYVPYVEYHPKLDCSKLSKLGLFKASGNFTITLESQFQFGVHYSKTEDGLDDSIKIRYKLNNELLFEYDFKLWWQKRTFGLQPYFVCPSTGKRVKYLLVVVGLLYTRHQLKFHYMSEHGTPYNRSVLGSRKIRLRFGLPMEFDYFLRELPKPPYIQNKTWESWVTKEGQYLQFALEKQEVAVQRLLKNHVND